MHYNIVAGTIPASLGQLNNLEQLWLYDNPELTGSIPAELGNLSQLIGLYLYDCSLTGTIPSSLGQLNNLNHLSLFGNPELIGSIPSELGNLSNLFQLDLSDCSLTGTIPASLGQPNNLLQQLWLYGNPELTGSIPAELGNLSKLTDLYLYDCSLTGTIPSSLGQPNNVLQQLWLYGNPELTGSIPAELGNLSNLIVLALFDCSLTGTIPASLGQLNSLQYLYLYGNPELTGSIPAELGNLSKLFILALDGCSLTGTIPASLGQLNNLQQLWLFNNPELTGSIPAVLGNLSQLNLLYLYECSLTGTIGSWMGNLTQLLYIQLDNNFLTGTIPSSIGQLTPLQLLYLDNNLLTDSIPSTLSNLTSLLELQLQHNKLNGNINNLFDSSTQQFLNFVDVSDNQLTGQLPTEVFLLPKLNTLVAVSNCFSGTLTATICNNTAMVSLILDGLQTATSCQQRLLPHTTSHSYSTYDSFHGHIPSCLFNMPNLISLHLSGNSLSGSLPEDLVVNDRLVDLTLSHNALTGSIPRAIQRRMWKQLDLSYNRLSGVLDSDFAASKDLTNTYSLQNNRLSRTVPSTLVDHYNVSLLGSNMFQCNLQKSDLPQHDDQRSNYQCGSDSFDRPFYLWLTVCFVLAVFIVASVWCVSTMKRSAGVAHVLECLQKWNLPKEELPRNICYVSAMGDILCQISVWCTALIVLVLVPWYAVASHYYGTYTHQYAWTVSAAFLSGPEATVVQLVVYLQLLAVMLGGLVLLLLRYDRQQHHVRSRVDTCSKDGRYELTLDEPRTLTQRLIVYWVYATVNIVVVGGVNVAFVLITLSESSRTLLFAQIGLSLFKLGWNTAATPHLIQYISAYISPTAQSTGFVAVQVMMALFNNIAIPCLIVAVISPSCFYSVFHPASTVLSLNLYQFCVLITPVGCLQFKFEVSQTAFDPPFTYDYQCSSSFVTYYAPAFVYLGIAAAFAVPLVKVTAQQLQKRCVVDSVLYHMLHYAIMSRILRPVSVLLPAGEVVSTDTKDTVVNTASTSAESVSFSRSSRSCVHYDTLQRDLFRPYFDANNYIISLVTYLGILLSFGVVFPPLAVVMCVTMLSVAWQAKITVGRFLCVTRELRLYKFEEIIEQECMGAATVMKLRQSVALIVVCSCWFYALFLFDTLGNAQGLARAYWVLIVMPLLPLCLLLGYAVHRNRRGELFRDSTDTSAVLQKEQIRDIELMLVPQDKQNIEVSEQESHVQDGQHYAATDIITADSSGATVLCEDSTINVLHI